MGVYKRGNTYWITFSSYGRQYRESANTTSKRHAEALLSKRRVEVFEGRFFPEKRNLKLSVAELRSLWLKEMSHKRSLKDDEGRFNTLVTLLGARTKVGELRTEDVGEMKRALMETTTRRGQKMAPSTVNRHLSLLNSALNLAELHGYTHQQPTAGVKMLPERNTRDRICTPEEFALLMREAEPELQAVIAMGYWTGMRLGEIAGLKWSQLNLSEGMVRLSAEETKTGEPRAVPLHAEVVKVLNGLPRRLNGKVFSKTDKRFSAMFHKLTRALDVSELRFHDLRHTAATNLRRAGVDLFTIKQITGHKTLKMLERYNCVNVDDLKEAMGKVQGHE